MQCDPAAAKRNSSGVKCLEGIALEGIVRCCHIGEVLSEDAEKRRAKRVVQHTRARNM